MAFIPQFSIDSIFFTNGNCHIKSHHGSIQTTIFAQEVKDGDVTFLPYDGNPFIQRNMGEKKSRLSVTPEDQAKIMALAKS